MSGNVKKKGGGVTTELSGMEMLCTLEETDGKVEKDDLWMGKTVCVWLALDS